MLHNTALLGIPSGIRASDNLLGEFQEHNYMVLTGNPGIGKTSLALNIAHKAAEEDVCLFFTTETTKKQLLKKLSALPETTPFD